MKKIYFSLFFIFVFLTAIISIKAQTASPFAGNWMLDREKTNTTKDFPQKMKNYKMAVTGTDAAINVRSQIEGDVEIETSGKTARTSTVIDNGSLTNRSSVSGPPPSSSINQGPEKVNYGGTMALFFTVNNASYNLNGEEVKTEEKQGLVRVKAKPDKSGKGLQFTTIRRMKMPNGEIEVFIREAWKLSEDGKTLKLQRTVETPTARDEILMFLSKVN